MKRLVCLAFTAGLAAYGSGPDRRQAIERGLHFIYHTACDLKNLEHYGEDYLWCLYSIGSTSRDPVLSRMALTMGRERAAVWVRNYASLPANANADQVASLVYGAYAAQQLGFPDPKLKESIRQAAARYSAVDYFLFDPSREPPPADLPETCGKCAGENPRGATVCKRCGARLKMQSRYDLWFDALTTAYFGDRYGVTLGAPYREVVRWLPAMRPYRGWEGGANHEFYGTFYSITHVVYTEDDYSKHRLSPSSLPAEFTFLKANLMEAAAMKDPEAMGEFLDSLKAFGLKKRNPLIRKGTDFLLTTQNADGSWGDMTKTDIYERYHPTWTAIDGLRDYKWKRRN